jgi:hypothetical protein
MLTRIYNALAGALLTASGCAVDVEDGPNGEMLVGSAESTGGGTTTTELPDDSGSSDTSKTSGEEDSGGETSGAPAGDSTSTSGAPSDDDDTGDTGGFPGGTTADPSAGNQDFCELLDVTTCEFFDQCVLDPNTQLCEPA